MATKTIVTKVDDIDGSVADSSFTFTWQGVRYDIDLNSAHAAELKADFAKWVSKARRHRFGGRQAQGSAAAKPAAPAAKSAAPAAKVAKPAAKRAASAAKAAKPAAKAGRPAGKSTTRKSTGPDPSLVRAWAQAEGRKVADRGRLAPALVADYLAAKAARVELAPVG